MCLFMVAPSWVLLLNGEKRRSMYSRYLFLIICVPAETFHIKSHLCITMQKFCIDIAENLH